MTLARTRLPPVRARSTAASIKRSAITATRTTDAWIPGAADGNPGKTDGFKIALFQALQGVDRCAASERLHAIKQAVGLGPADNVLFDRTGGVFDPRTRELLGSLTQKGPG